MAEDSPTVVAIALAVSGAITAFTEAFKAKSRKRIKDSQGWKSVHSLSGSIDLLAQRVHETENRMYRYEQKFEGIVDSVDEIVLSYTKSTAEIMKDLQHLREQIHDLKDDMKGKRDESR